MKKAVSEFSTNFRMYSYSIFVYSMPHIHTYIYIYIYAQPKKTLMDYILQFACIYLYPCILIYSSKRDGADFWLAKARWHKGGCDIDEYQPRSILYRLKSIHYRLRSILYRLKSIEYRLRSIVDRLSCLRSKSSVVSPHYVDLISSPCDLAITLYRQNPFCDSS